MTPTQTSLIDKTPVDVKRGRPYVWVSWLTRLLAGENACVWKAWYKAHYKVPKDESPEREAFFAEQTIKHDAIQDVREKELKDAGYTVKREEQGEFKLRGSKGDLAGKPDLVGMNATEALIVEVKSGKQRESDAWQVLIYWFALSLDWLKGSNLRIRGEVAYKGGVTRKVEALTPQSHAKIADLLKLVTGDEEPLRTPGKWDCEYCDIQSCPDRFQAAEAADASGVF